MLYQTTSLNWCHYRTEQTSCRRSGQWNPAQLAASAYRLFHTWEAPAVLVFQQSMHNESSIDNTQTDFRDQCDNKKKKRAQVPKIAVNKNRITTKSHFTVSET